MSKKLYFAIFVLSILFIATVVHAAAGPLSPEDAQYRYPVKFLFVNGNKVAYVDEGQGPAVIFIHGLSATLASFEMLYPELMQNGYRTVGIDLLGYGKSDKPDIKYSIPFHADTVIGFIKQLGLKNVVLVGHSMGGTVSLYAAIKEPELVKKLILLTPGGLEEYSIPTVVFVKTFYNQVLGGRFSDLEKAAKYYRTTVYQWSPGMDEFLKTRQRMMIHLEWRKVQKTIKDGAISAMEVPKEILPKIAEIKKSVLVLLADHDTLVSTKKIKANIEKRTKDWKIEVFEKCGHMIQYDQQEKTVSRILEFLK